MASSKEIEREVETQRANVESTLDALKHKMSVGQIVDEVQGYFGADEAREAMRNAGRQVRENPLALGLVGVGIAWLMFGGGRRDDDYAGGYGSSSETYPGAPGGTRYGSAYGSPYGTAGASGDSGGEGVTAKVSRAVGGVGERVSSLVSGAGERVSQAVSGVSDTLSSAKDAGARRAQGFGDTVSSHAPSGEALSRRGRQVKGTLAEAIERQPLMVGAFAVAVGAAIGAALPATRTESRWLGDARDGLMDQAKRVATDLREQAVDAAEAGLAAATETAKREGLVPEGEGQTLAAKVEKTVRAGVEGAKERLDETSSQETERA